MRFILLAIFLLFTCNTYAVILNESYIYPEDDKELTALKEKLKISGSELGKSYLKLFKNNRESAYRGYDRDEEAVYRVGDTSKKDIGAKIGMSTDQVLNKSYWGKPDNKYTAIDANDKLELWTYKRYGYRKGTTKRTGLLFFINGKLTHIIN